MAEEKTEQPSEKKLRDARQKGQVAKSQDVPSALTTLAIVLYFIAMRDIIYENLIVLTEFPFLVISQPYEEAFAVIFPGILYLIVLLTLPFVLMIILVGLIANIGQVGIMFSAESAMPKLENISPKKWFTKVFGVKNAVELLKNILKVSVIGYAVYKVFMDYLPTLFKIPSSNIDAMWSVLGASILDMLIFSAAAFSVIAAADFVFQKFQFTKQNMMTKEEVKREYKESEGDPHIKGKRKQLHQEMANQSTVNNTRKAKVLITNPTHYAIALDYDKEKVPLPLILAKGEGALAKRMIEIAKEEKIPIMRNVELAQALFKDGTENAYIPKELIVPVAEVLRFVQSLK